MAVTLHNLKRRYSKKLNQLIEYGNLGLYGDDGIVAYEEALGITKIYSDELAQMALDKDFNELEYYDDNMEKDSFELSATFAPCHALIALASLEVDDAFKKIMDSFDTIDPEDNYYLFAFDYYMAAVYTKNIDFVNAILLDKKEDDEKRIRILYIFKEVMKWFEDKKSLKAIKDTSMKLLNQNEKNKELNDLTLNVLLAINEHPLC